MSVENLVATDLSTWDLPGLALHKAMDRLRERGPLAAITFLGAPAWLVTDHATLTMAFKDTQQLPPQRAYQLGIMPLIGENFQTMEGERHRLYRKLATPTFRPRMVEQMDSALLSEVANELIDSFSAESEVDIVSAFSERYPYIVIARLLGIPRDEERKFADWVVGLLNFTSNPERAYRCRDELWSYLDPVIEARRREPRDDIISQLIHDEVDGVKMDDALLKSHIGILFSAGSSTTHDSIGNLLYGLLSTAGSWDEVRDNPALRDGAIEEALRWEPAVSFLPRMSRADQVSRIAGIDIPPESFVFMGIAAANHDPAVYDDPHAFDIHRQDSRKMTFGHGPRMCPGMHLARMNLRATLDVLLERLPQLELLSTADAAPSGTVFRNSSRLPCRLRS